MTVVPEHGQTVGVGGERGVVPLPPLLLLDSDGIVTHVSETVPPLLGYENGELLLGRRCRDFCTEPDQAEAAAAEYRQNGYWQGRFATRRCDGSPLELHAKAWMVHTRGTLYQTVMILLPSGGCQEPFPLFGPHKMVVLPEVVVRGMVHDINNALVVPTATLDYLRGLLPPEDRVVQDLLKDCVEACRTAALVTNQMGEWLRSWMDRSGEQETVDIVDLTRMAVRLAMSGSSVRVAFDEVGVVGSVRGEKASLCRVFLNLAMNARQAMRDEGRLHVRAESVLDDAGGSPRRYARISMADTGGGMPREALDRLFTLGFSTKPGEEGEHGIGLAVSAHMVREHQGRITVESEPGKGTTFHVWLPAM